MNITGLSLQLQKQVINYLRQNYHLPNSGFLAGQAVASVVYKFLNLPFDCVINDLDVFQLANESTFKFKEQGCKDHNMDALIGLVHDYEGITISCNETGRGYRVVRALDDPEFDYLNLIHIKIFNEIDQGCIPFEGILRTFDFNLCSVGVDLSNDTFYWTESFINFLNTFELQVQSSHTPIRCLIRLNKKLKEFPNIKCNIRELQQMFIFCHLFTEHESNITGIKFWEKFEANKEGIEDYLVFDDFYFENHKLYRSVSFDFDYLKKQDIAPFLNDMPYNSSYYLNDKLFIPLEDSIKLNATQVVHFYHLNYNTGMFSQDYKEKVKYFLSYGGKRQKELYQALYFKIVSNKPFMEVDLPTMAQMKSIEKLFLKHANFSCSLKQHFESFSELFEFFEIYKTILDTDTYFLIPLATNNIITHKELVYLHNSNMETVFSFLAQKDIKSDKRGRVFKSENIYIKEFNNFLELVNFNFRNKIKSSDSIYYRFGWNDSRFNLFFFKVPLSQGFFVLTSKSNNDIVKCFRINDTEKDDLNHIESGILSQFFGSKSDNKNLFENFAKLETHSVSDVNVNICKLQRSKREKKLDQLEQRVFSIDTSF